jgi:hypothetical protein
MRRRALETSDFAPKSACILILIAMGICGFAYKGIAHRLQKSEMPIKLAVPLQAFPLVIGDWSGTVAPLDVNAVEIAGNDDFCNRHYVNTNTGYWANIYIAYSARPRTMLGHRPDVCYVGAGWVHDSTEVSSFISKSGTKVPCLIHRFHLPGPHQEDLVVLNFYIINGKTSAEESGFSGLEWRTPNINGDIARYVAQIQISSMLENVVRAAAADTADSMLDFFPNSTKIAETAEDLKTGI